MVLLFYYEIIWLLCACVCVRVQVCVGMDGFRYMCVYVYEGIGVEMYVF